VESKEIIKSFIGVQVACTASYITHTASCLMPALRLPSALADATSTTSDVSGAAASFIRGSTRVDIFVGVRMNNPLSYHDLNTSLVFYPPPTIITASGRITVIRGKTVTLTIKVSRLFSVRRKLAFKRCYNECIYIGIYIYKLLQKLTINQSINR